MNTTSGQASEAAATMADTAQVAENKFKNAAENFKIAVGEALLPMLTEIRTIGKDAFDWMTDFVKNNQGVVAAFTGIASALGILSGELLVFTKVAPRIKSVLNEIKIAFAENPATLAVLGVTAAISGLMIAVEAWEEQQAQIEGTTQNLRKTFQETTSAVEDNAKARREAAESLQDEYGGYSVMIGKLQELNSVENKTTEQKAEMQALVNNLSSVIPGLAEAYDAETGALNMTNAELATFVQRTKEAAMAQAAAQNQMQIAEDLYKVEQQIEKAQAALDGYQEEVDKLRTIGMSESEIYGAVEGYYEANRQMTELAD
jgi:riboflavin synthase alpha subunit